MAVAASACRGEPGVTPEGPWGKVVPWLLAGCLAVSACGAFGMGLWQAWVRNGDDDMHMRVAEYAAFRVGDYPNKSVDMPKVVRTVPFTVYPPYAFPMFVAFFEPGGRLQGRIVVEALTLVAIVIMGFYGYERLKSFGTAWATVGALAGAGMACNGTTVALGQFSTVCAGLLVLQVMVLERGWAAVGGLSWAAAMIKPQVGVAFSVLFLVNRQIRGLACGIGVLVALGAVALWWTETSAATMLHYWLFRMQMKFAVESGGVGPGHVAEWLGVNHRLAQYAALVALAGLGLAAVIVARLVQRDIAVPDLLPLAGMSAVLGRVLTYHRHYDNSMLFPLLLAWLSVALATPTAANVATAVAVGLTLWIPMRVQEWVPLIQFIQPAIWIIAGLRLASVAVSGSPPPDAERPGAG